MTISQAIASGGFRAVVGAGAQSPHLYALAFLPFAFVPFAFVKAPVSGLSAIVWQGAS